jgi:Heat induced stress protein YflT domain
MSAKNRAVFGIYVSQLDAENAVHGLKLSGFRSTDISILFPDNAGTKDLALERNTKAPEGTAAGASLGAVAGAILGWLAGIGALAIPGLGVFVAAGPILGLLSGIGVGGVLGGITGALVGLGTPEYEAKRYEGRIRKGGILVSVHCDDRDWVKSARAILEQTGAEDVSATTEAKADFAKSDRPRPRTLISKAKVNRFGLTDLG